MNSGNHDQVIEQTKNQVFELLKQTIRPEFLNRVDELIMFAPLNQQEIESIVKLQIGQLQQLLSNTNIKLEISENALRLLAQAGFDPQFGARPVKRAIQRLLLNELSKSILSGKVSQNSSILVESEGDKLVFSN